MGRPAIDLTGQSFGRLTVLERAGRRDNNALWKCRCSCAAQTIIDVPANCLRKGLSKSCGCLVSERLRTHGLTGTRVYTIWRNMRWRCENPNRTDYADYGGRGIRVCARWKDLSLFVEDMGLPPSDQHTIERRDVNGNYEPENCIWALVEEQQNNKRNNVRLSARGQSMTLAQWSRHLNIPVSRIRSRLRRGWCDEHALYGKE
jgi:hypothetical protein